MGLSHLQQIADKDTIQKKLFLPNYGSLTFKVSARKKLCWKLSCTTGITVTSRIPTRTPFLVSNDFHIFFFFLHTTITKLYFAMSIN